MLGGSSTHELCWERGTYSPTGPFQSSLCPAASSLMHLTSLHPDRPGGCGGQWPLEGAPPCLGRPTLVAVFDEERRPNRLLTRRIAWPLPYPKFLPTVRSRSMQPNNRNALPGPSCETGQSAQTAKLHFVPDSMDSSAVRGNGRWSVMILDDREFTPVPS